MSVNFDNTMRANDLMRDVFQVAVDKNDCLRVAKWFADGGVVRVVKPEGKNWDLEYLTADQVLGRTRRGIG